MPKIIIHFEAPESVKARADMDKELKDLSAVYYCILGNLILKGQCQKDIMLKDSCVILDVREIGSCDVEARYGDLKYPDRQLNMLAHYLIASSYAGWMGIGQIGVMTASIGQAMNVMLQNSMSSKIPKGLILPGGMSPGNNPFMS